MDTLLQYDYELFQLINSGWHNPIYDAVMPILRDKYTWFPLYLFLLVFLLVNFRVKGLLLVLALAMAVGLSDYTNSQLLKKSVKRLRPCHVLEQPQDMHLLVPCGSGYSFPSSHAANHFCLALMLSFAGRRRWPWLPLPLLAWAGLVALAQVYVGVHFPFDVVAGATWGGLLAGLVWSGCRALNFLSSKDFQ